MRVLVNCEYSATVRDAFRAKGHDAWSCDLLPTDGDPAWHIQGDAIATAYAGGWDLMICHPPCTDLAVSGAMHFAAKIADGRQQRALDFVRALLNAPIPMIALENPVSVISTKIRKPDQVIHPWMFGHMEQKTTCLWLKGLPLLRETHNVRHEMMALPKNQRERLHYLPPGPNRWKERSKTFAGIAEAMADQWGSVTLQQAGEIDAVVGQYVLPIPMNEENETLPLFGVMGDEPVHVGGEHRAHDLLGGGGASQHDALLVLNGDGVTVGEEPVHDAADDGLFGGSVHDGQFAGSDDLEQAA